MKTFKECLEIDLTKVMQKKPTFYKDKDGRMQKTTQDKWLDYVEWAKILELLYTECEATSVQFDSEIHKEKKGTLIITINIDGNEFTCNYPIIDGNAVINEPNQMQLHKAKLILIFI